MLAILKTKAKTYLQYYLKYLVNIYTVSFINAYKYRKLTWEIWLWRAIYLKTAKSRHCLTVTSRWCHPFYGDPSSTDLFRLHVVGNPTHQSLFLEYMKATFISNAHMETSMCQQKSFSECQQHHVFVQSSNISVYFSRNIEKVHSNHSSLLKRSKDLKVKQ